MLHTRKQATVILNMDDECYYKFSIVSLGVDDIKEEVCHTVFYTWAECLHYAMGSLEFFVQPDDHQDHPFFVITTDCRNRHEEVCVCPYVQGCFHTVF